MEGVSHEACSLAGTLGLGKLIVFYDDNGISIDGDVRGWFSDDTPMRFESYGWQVIRGVDGHDATEVETALKTARQETSRPTLICCRTVIGFGSPNLAGSEKTHGAPLGDAEIEATRHAMGWVYGPFEIPENIQSAWDAREQGAIAQAEWDQLFVSYQKEYPDLATEFERRIRGDLPEGALIALDDAISKTQSNRRNWPLEKLRRMRLKWLPNFSRKRLVVLQIWGIQTSPSGKIAKRIAKTTLVETTCIMACVSSVCVR